MSASPPPSPTRCAAATPRRTPRRCAQVLEGAPGPYRDVVLLNAAAALVVAGKAASFADGVALAKHSLDTGAAEAAP